jgi:YihY family inner membrane protein
VTASLHLRRSARGRLRLIAAHPFAFLRRVGRGLKKNQVFLLSGAVAYNALLSIIPFFALILLGLSHFVDTESLLEILESGVELVIPSDPELVVNQVRDLLAVKDVGWVAIGLLLFFSASAFLVLERSLERIFEHRSRLKRRHLLVSVVIPYLYMLVLGLIMTAMTVSAGLLAGLEERIPAHLFERLENASLGAAGLVLEFMLLTSFYKIMPAGGISLGRAAVGGLAATLLWDATRGAFVWYLSNVSPVNLVYGSLATVVVALLLLEMGALILLTGAQVIAEYERFVYREHYATTRRTT